MLSTYHLTIEKRIPGDANDNGVVNVADLVTISDYIVHKEVFDFCFVNADVIEDKQITTADVTATVNIIMDDVPSLTRLGMRRGAVISIDRLIVDDFTVSPSHSFNIGIDLDATNSYSALQTSILLPDGMSVEEISLGEKAKHHILNYNQIDDSRIELIIYSFNNAVFTERNGNLFNLIVNAEEDCGDLILTAINASDARSNEFELRAEGGHNLTQTTTVAGVDDSSIVVSTYVSGVEIRNAEGCGFKVYSLAGEAIVSDIAKSNVERISLEKGIYLVVINDKAFKALVK